jgi:hypothetical protein
METMRRRMEEEMDHLRDEMKKRIRELEGG